MSDCRASAAPAPVSDPPLGQMCSLLEAAAEQMMVHMDFQAAFRTCSRGLEDLSSLELQDNRWVRARPCLRAARWYCGDTGCVCALQRLGV